MKIKILTLLFVMSSTALAADTMRYTAAAGTITKYGSITNTTTQALEPVTATASDGSEPTNTASVRPLRPRRCSRVE